MLKSMRDLSVGLNTQGRGSHDHGRQAHGFGFLRSAERGKLEAFLNKGVVWLFYFEIDNYSMFRDLFGPAVGQALLEHLEREIAAKSGEFLPGPGFSILERVEMGAFVLLRAQDDDRRERIPSSLAALRLHLKASLRRESLRLSGQALDVVAGCAELAVPPKGSLENALYTALCDAQRSARGLLDAGKLGMLREFREIVAGQRLGAVYQPIVDLSSGAIMAWEALARGPQDSPFHSPSVLFDFAEEAGQVFHLERACREAAIRDLGGLGPDQRLFLNIHPRTLVSPDFSPGETLGLLERSGMSPRQVVFEITERHCVKDFTLFHRTLEHYRSQGYQVAVDDVGTGYSGLWSIAEIRPDFLKIDMSLVRNIDTNPVKRALLETFVAFADKIGCRLIAEGVETVGELSTLVHLGVHYGQGYHLSRPAHPKPSLVTPLPRRGLSRGALASLELKCSLPLREVTEPAQVVRPGTPVNEVRQLLHGSEAISAVVVVEDERPQGLVMSHHLDRALSTRYGLSLYEHRDVTRIMDPAPLAAEADTPVEVVARKAMGREKFKIYDHIVVTDRGRYAGIASVQRILDTLALVQVEMAKGASPLTGLPGNVSIERELEARSAGGSPFSIVYADLDNFKAYNDTYGFTEGDGIILLLSRIMAWAVRRHGANGDFLGHVGGDDFVLLTRPEHAERICKAVVRCFGRLVRARYRRCDRERGYITAKDRAGRLTDFPLVSVSLAIVDCLGECSLDAIGLRAAEMKQFAKTMPGNSWSRDRRSPLGRGTEEPA